jgi:hypothetical protein
MKNIMIMAALSLALASCGLGEKKEHKLDKVDLTITIPGKTVIECLDSTDYRKANCEFTLNKKRNEIQEITLDAVPTDLAMLEEALKADEDFVGVKEKKTLPNGAFGIVFDKKGKTKTIQDFVFYFKNGARAYRISPVFNSDGDNYNDIFEAIGTLK